MRIAITGASGFIGTALGRALRADGHEVVPVVRRDARPGEISWDPAGGRLDPGDLAGLDAVVNLAGAGIGDARWTAERKRELVESRTRSTRLLSEAMAAAPQAPPVLVSGSAIGYYGDRDDEVLTERSAPGTDFVAGLCVQWEAATEPAEAAGVRVAHIRSGVVLDGSGGIFPRMALPFRFGVGGRLGSGRQWMSWISLADEVGAIMFCLTNERLSGPVNLTAPEPVTNAEFTKTLGRQLHRPTLVPTPTRALHALFGEDMVREMLLGGPRAVPAKLQEHGFRWLHPTLEVALRDILG